MFYECNRKNNSLEEEILKIQKAVKELISAVKEMIVNLESAIKKDREQNITTSKKTEILERSKK